jgi:hypothetical protein
MLGKADNYFDLVQTRKQLTPKFDASREGSDLVDVKHRASVKETIHSTIKK